MPINPYDIPSSYLIETFKNSIDKGNNKITKTVSTPPDGTKTVTFTAVFGSGEAGDVLRISDGSTTKDFTCAETGGSNAGPSLQIGSGGDRSANLVANEFVNKINGAFSGGTITATINAGGTSTNASFKLVPGTGITITITEDPGNANGGNFGHTAGHTVITSGGGSTTTTEFQMSPFRFSVPGVRNLRNQSAENSYKSFIGDQKS